MSQKSLTSLMYGIIRERDNLSDKLKKSYTFRASAPLSQRKMKLLLL
jgi:hypothetical protein